MYPSTMLLVCSYLLLMWGDVGMFGVLGDLWKVIYSIIDTLTEREEFSFMFLGNE